MSSPSDLGKADWTWEPTIGCHVPGCSVTLGLDGKRVDPFEGLVVGRCGNGPLEGEALLSGDCGEHE